MKIFLANDTASEPHAGCLAVSNAHQKLLREIGSTIITTHYVHQGHEIYDGNETNSVRNAFQSMWGDAIHACDALVVNGEGTIHHNAGMHLLAMLGAAQSIGKKTFLVNCVLQECAHFKNVFASLTDLTVREPRSAFVARCLGGKPRVVADSCLSADFQDDPAHNFKNEILVGDAHENLPDINNTLSVYASDKPVWRVKDHERVQDWKQAVATLKTARLYVTGRHHGVYLSAMAGIPFVVCPSNTHKVESLIEWSGCNIPICRSLSEIKLGIDYAFKHPHVYQQFSRFLLSQQPLTTFQELKKHQSA